MKDVELWDTLITIAIAAGLAYMAYGTGWHSALFGFMAFVAYSVGNRVSRGLKVLERAADRRAAERYSP